MLKRSSAALLGMVLFAGAAAAQETTIKFTLGWKTQGSDAAFFYARGQRLLQGGRPQRRDRPGRRLGRDGDARDVRRL